MQREASRFQRIVAGCWFLQPTTWYCTRGGRKVSDAIFKRIAPRALRRSGRGENVGDDREDMIVQTARGGHQSRRAYLWCRRAPGIRLIGSRGLAHTSLVVVSKSRTKWSRLYAE